MEYKNNIRIVEALKIAKSIIINNNNKIIDNNLTSLKID